MLHRFVLTALLAALSCCPGVTAETPEDAATIDAVRGLIQRVTPSIAPRFELQLIPQSDGKNVFELESVGDTIVLRGDNGISLASAYNRYLQTHCHCLVSLWGSQMKLPDPLPAVPAKERVVTPRKLRHFFNYCTFNYSGAWWKWDDWEKIIDWLAMNGVNMPLNIVGVEAAWYHAFLELGLTDDEARACLAAPVYLNWQWMGNLEGTGGPLPKAWIDSHEELGRRIMAREQALGMTPILHGFSGVVPRIFHTKFPDAHISRKPAWGRGTFLPTITLDPVDPLFARVEGIYLRQLIQRFGTSHFYMIDPFHESNPPDSSAAYLQSVAKTIDKTLLEIDPQAQWVCQDWTLRPDIIKSIPRERLVIMSLTGGKTKEYRDWGYSYTVGQLNSFGGETHLHGPLVREAANAVSQEMAQSPNCVGSGNWMESLENSPAYYHFMLDLNWESGAVDLQQRLDDYCLRRYGGISENIRAMNRLLTDSVYQIGGHGFSSIVAARPTLFPIKSTPVREISFPKKNGFQKHVQAWEALLADRERFKTSPGYQYDAVDLGRQVLSDFAIYYQRDTALYAFRRDLAGFRRARDRFLGLLDDLDEMLGTQRNFLFGRWLAQARTWGTTKEESARYTAHAAMLVTLWGQDNPQAIEPAWQDYAGREWNGLIKHYYRKRWELFYNEVEKRLARGEIFEDVMRDKWGRPLTVADKSGFYAKLYQFEISFGDNLPEMSAQPTGDAAETAWRVYQKYRDDLHAIPSEPPVLAGLFEPVTYDKTVDGEKQRSVKLKDDVLKKVLAAKPYFGDASQPASVKENK